MKKFIKSLAVFLALVMVFYVIPLSSLASGKNISEYDYSETEYDYSAEEPVITEQEETEKRTANTKTFKMPDGTHKIYIYSSDIHILTDEGWIDIPKIEDEVSEEESTSLTTPENDTSSIASEDKSEPEAEEEESDDPVEESESEENNPEDTSINDIIEESQKETAAVYTPETAQPEIIQEEAYKFEFKKSIEKETGKLTPSFSLPKLPVLELDDIIIIDSKLHFKVSGTDYPEITSYKKAEIKDTEKQSAIDKDILTAVPVEGMEVNSRAVVSADKSAHLDITDIARGLLNGETKQFTLGIPEDTEISVLDTNIVMTVSYVTNDEYNTSGTWDAYDSFGHVTSTVNAFNGSIRVLQADISTGGNIMPLTVTHYHDMLGEANNILGYGWNWNVEERIAVVSSSKILRYDHTGNIKEYNRTTTTMLTNDDLDDPSYYYWSTANNYIEYNDGFDNKIKYSGSIYNALERTDSSGNKTEYIYNSSRILTNIKINNTTYLTFTYNSNGALTKITNNITGDYVQYQYSTTYSGTVSSSNKGYLRQVNYKDGTGHTYSYNSNGTISRVYDINKSSTTRVTYAYTTKSYGDLGSRTALNTISHFEKNLERSYLFTYKDLSAIIKQTPLGNSIGYNYKPNGKIRSSYSHNASTTTISASTSNNYNASDLLKSTGSGNFSSNTVCVNPLRNSDFESSSSWTLSGGSYTTDSTHGRVMKVTGNNGYSYASQTLSQSYLTAAGINNKSDLMLSGWVKPYNSLAVEMDAPYTRPTFGFSIVLRYQDGSVEDVRINGNYKNQEWQYISFLVIPTNKSSTLTAATVYCSYDNNSGYALYDNVRLTVANSNVFTYNTKELPIQNKTPFGAYTTGYSDYYVSNQKSASGMKEIYTYSNNKVSSIQQQGIGVIDNTTAYTYNSSGNVTNEKTTAGSQYMQNTYTYTSDNQYLAGITDTRGRTTTYSYNSDKTISYTQDNNLNRTVYNYTNGRIYRIFADQNKDGTVNTSEPFVLYSFGTGENFGNVTTIDTNSASYGIQYTARGSNVASVSQGSVTLASYEYDTTTGLMSKKTLGNGLTFEYGYDVYGNLKRVKKGDWYKRYFDYNADGSLLSMYDMDSVITHVLDYDAYGRVSKDTSLYSNSQKKVERAYQYDQYSRPSQTTEKLGGSSTAFNYKYTYYDYTDLIKNVELDPNHYVYYSYDSFGRITSKQQRRTSTGGTVFGGHSYTYHGGSGANSTSSVISSVTLHSGTTFNYSYSNLEYISTIKEGSTTKQTFAYDSLGQLTRENNAYTGKTYVYTYDVAGNKTGKKTYAYTTGAVGTVQSTETYTYGSTANTRNRLTNYNGTSISYDGMGNPTSWRNSSSLSWEGKDLKSVYLGAIGGVNYTYTAEGLRTKKVQSYYGLTVNYYYDSSDNLIYEDRVRSSGTERLHYQYDANGIMGLIYTNASGSIQHYWFGKNAQGDVIDIYNGTGGHVARYNYDAWGVCTIASDTTASGIATINPIRYRSYYYDTETSWYYLRTRYYDPGVGRFLSADSILGANGDLLSYNMYLYCSNNPVNYADPSGNFFISVTALCMIAGGLLIGTAGGIAGYNIGKSNGLSGWQLGLATAGGAVGGTLLGMAAGYFVGPYAAAALGISGFEYASGHGFISMPPTGVGQGHHILTNKIMRALNGHQTLSGVFNRNDYIFTAWNEAAHRGYQTWHRLIDDNMLQWLRINNTATVNQFWEAMFNQYNTPDMIRRFGSGVVDFIRKIIWG